MLLLLLHQPNLILVPAGNTNLKKSIDQPVDIEVVKKFLPVSFVDELMKKSGKEGIKCFGMTRNRKFLFDKLQEGDHVLFSKKGTGLFTHFCTITGKITNADLGNALWPAIGKNPYENIYFLNNIIPISIEKSILLKLLGYAEGFNLLGPIMVNPKVYHSLGSIKNYSREDTIVLEPKTLTAGFKVRPDEKNIDIAEKCRRCEVCGRSGTILLTYSSIRSWIGEHEILENPENHLCLCQLHKIAFEKGHMGLDDSYRIILNPRLTELSVFYEQLVNLNGNVLEYLSHALDKELLRRHRMYYNLE